MDSGSESPFNLYLDDVGDEVEIGEDEEESCTNMLQTKATAGPGRKRKEADGGTKRKRKMLNTKEKARVMLLLCDVDISAC